MAESEGVYIAEPIAVNMGNCPIGSVVVVSGTNASATSLSEHDIWLVRPDGDVTRHYDCGLRKPAYRLSNGYYSLIYFEIVHHNDAVWSIELAQRIKDRIERGGVGFE